MYIEKVVISKDPDGISSSIKPKWLVTLLDKYKNSNNTNNSTTNTNAAASDSATDAAVVVTPPSVTVGKFCRYLSNLIVDRNSTNGTNGNGANWDEDTSAAIEELLQASSDNITLFGSSSSSSIANITVGSSNTTNPTPNNAATATTAATATNPHALYSQPYYARRLFNFISKLNEMKSIPKDEKSL